MDAVLGVVFRVQRGERLLTLALVSQVPKQLPKQLPKGGARAVGFFGSLSGRLPGGQSMLAIDTVANSDSQKMRQPLADLK